MQPNPHAMHFEIDPGVQDWIRQVNDRILQITGADRPTSSRFNGTVIGSSADRLGVDRDGALKLNLTATFTLNKLFSRPGTHGVSGSEARWEGEQVVRALLDATGAADRPDTEAHPAAAEKWLHGGLQDVWMTDFGRQVLRETEYEARCGDVAESPADRSQREPAARSFVDQLGQVTGAGTHAELNRLVTVPAADTTVAAAAAIVEHRSDPARVQNPRRRAELVAAIAEGLNDRIDHVVDHRSSGSFLDVLHTRTTQHKVRGAFKEAVAAARRAEPGHGDGPTFDLAYERAMAGVAGPGASAPGAVAGATTGGRADRPSVAGERWDRRAGFVNTSAGAGSDRGGQGS